MYQNNNNNYYNNNIIIIKWEKSIKREREGVEDENEREERERCILNFFSLCIFLRSKKIGP